MRVSLSDKERISRPDATYPTQPSFPARINRGAAKTAAGKGGQVGTDSSPLPSRQEPAPFHGKGYYFSMKGRRLFLDRTMLK